LTRRERLVQDVGENAPWKDIDLWFIDTPRGPRERARSGRSIRAHERGCGTSVRPLRRRLVGHHFTELLAPEEREKVAAQFRRAAEYGEPTDFETVFVDAGGQLRGTRAQHLPLRSGGEIVGVLILAFDARRPPSDSNGPEAQPQLTDRQREILDLIASGQSTSEIAQDLTLSTETVRNHLRGVFRELHAHTRLEAIARARRYGLLAPPVLGPCQALKRDSPAG
jgi:DNA-binding CsgD family transcriptional regulator